MSAISPQAHPKKSVNISGRKMAYVEMGEGDPIVFLHGNPTSSYLWRNVMPHLKDQGRCIAPDLIGMGDSDKLEPSGPERYTFREHRRFLDAFLESLGIEKNVTLVIHDWGSALGFDWANRNRNAVAGIAYMEGIVRPMTWDEWSPSARRIFEGFRSVEGEKMILEKNLFIEAVLPGSILRKLTDAEMEVYRAPFREPGEDRRPTLSWPRQIPLGGEPADVVEIAQSYADWMAANGLPKLFINADPGAILIGAQREFCRGWKNQTEITVKGNHFIQEDSPHEIGEAIAAWRKSWAQNK
ncbi:MAG: haloalkane dehalogenase [Parvibaculum sp.]|uniref:haloalkane dehalogenase n=1 Tax=Parvibaculum sp. TaxID=2024848 RepID=UPI0025DE265D|nr:haloalkane dehalogenase [Parvibaculum sp.]MCE9648548.1 haloalkane dehalogenase [Parvibaculum sp.]